MFLVGFYAGAAGVVVALLILRYFAAGAQSLKHRRSRLPPATARQIRRADKQRRLRLGVSA